MHDLGRVFRAGEYGQIINKGVLVIHYWMLDCNVDESANTWQLFSINPADDCAKETKKIREANPGLQSLDECEKLKN